MDLTPDELCAAYREQLRRLYGDEIAQKAQVDYKRGWYYIAITWASIVQPYREVQVLAMLEALKECTPNQQTERR